MRKMKYAACPLAASLIMVAFSAMAQTQSNQIGNNGGSIDQQIIGDTSASADHTQSTSNQIGNSANANGASVSGSNANDVRNQNTASGGAGGASSAIGNTSSNNNAIGQANTGNSQIGNTSSNSGGNNLATGPSTSNSGGNILGAGGSNTLTNGSNTATNTAQGGNSSSGGNVLGNNGGNTNSTNTNTANGGTGGQGGAGGTVAGSGNSANTNAQGQQQANNGTNAQGQTSSNRNTSNVTGGAQANTSRTNVGGQNASTQSGVGQSGNSTVSTTIGGSSYTDNSRVVFIPPVVPPTPPSTLAVGNIVKETTACGPLQTLVKTPVNGKFFGLFGTDDVPQGFTYDLEPQIDAAGRIQTYAEIPLPDGSGYRMIGNQAIIFATVIGTSNARNLAIGGGGSQGNWGQGGTGTSAANQQLVTNIQLKACDVGTVKFIKAAPVVQPLPVIEKAPE